MILVQIIWYILLFSTTTRGSSQRDILREVFGDDLDIDETTSTTTSSTTTISTATTRICEENEVQCEPANSKIEFKQCFSEKSRYDILMYICIRYFPYRRKYLILWVWQS